MVNWIMLVKSVLSSQLAAIFNKGNATVGCQALATEVYHVTRKSLSRCQECWCVQEAAPGLVELCCLDLAVLRTNIYTHTCKRVHVLCVHACVCGSKFSTSFSV